MLERKRQRQRGGRGRGRIRRGQHPPRIVRRRGRAFRRGEMVGPVGAVLLLRRRRLRLLGLIPAATAAPCRCSRGSSGSSSRSRRRRGRVVELMQRLELLLLRMPVRGHAAVATARRNRGRKPGRPRRHHSSRCRRVGATTGGGNVCDGKLMSAVRHPGQRGPAARSAAASAACLVRRPLSPAVGGGAQHHVCAGMHRGCCGGEFLLQDA